MRKNLKISLEKSFLYQEKAKKFIPGMTQLLSKRPDRFSQGVWPTYFSRAKGAKVWDLDNNRYTDMSLGGIGANVLGYADSDVDNAVKNTIDKGTSSTLNCSEEIDLAELLCEIHPWAQNVRYTRSGGEAMVVAVRIARAYNQRDKIAFCGYHGWHDWYLAANLRNDDALEGHLMSGLSPVGVPIGLTGTAFPFRYNKIKELELIFAENKNKIAAVVMEPIRNFKPESNFLEDVEELVNKNNSVLIIDEISAGFRLNPGGAHLLFGIEPDIAVFSKAIGNGYPIAAIIGKNYVMNAAEKTFISSTNWTERIGPVAALTTIKKYKEYNVANHLVEIGEMIQGGWNAISKKYGIEIKIEGIPPLSHFEFRVSNPKSMKAFYIQNMLKYGFLASNHFYSMYAHKEEDVENYLNAFDLVFSQLADKKIINNIDEMLLGNPSISGFKRFN